MDGELKCLNSAIHLKNKFNVGYELKVNFVCPNTREIYNLM